MYDDSFQSTEIDNLICVRWRVYLKNDRNEMKPRCTELSCLRRNKHADAYRNERSVIRNEDDADERKCCDLVVTFDVLGF